MPSQRPNRVGEQIHQEVSALLINDINDPRIGFVTITAVEMTPDLHLARIFYTVMGDEKARRESEKGLRNAVPYLRRELGRRMRMRYTPDILFQYDTSIDTGNRIESLLRDIHVDRPEDQGNSEED